MAQFVALAASIAALVLPGQDKKKDSPSTRNISPSAAVFGPPCAGFLFVGLVSGASVALIFFHYFQSLRIRERIRFNCLGKCQSHDDGDLSTTVKEYSLGESSVVRVLVDARNSVSSHLHCIEITLKPGTGLVPRISSCVEYYYVLRGEGMYRYGCNEDDAEMQETIMNTGNHIIVQPWQIRSIVNLSKENLVLLRIADSQKEFSKESGEEVIVVGRNIPASYISVASELQSTLHKVGNTLKKNVMEKIITYNSRRKNGGSNC